MASMFTTMKEEPHIKYIKGSEEYILITHCNFTSTILRQNTHIFSHKAQPILLWKMKGLFLFCLIFSILVCSQRLLLLFIAVFPQMEMCLSSFVRHHVIKSKKQNKGSRNQRAPEIINKAMSSLTGCLFKLLLFPQTFSL